MPLLAVVIVSWNVRELLASCLRSLFDDLSTSDADAIVWVVDNASADGTPAMVADRFPEVRLIAKDENLGFAAGNNVALQGLLSEHRVAGRVPFVWLLNPDTQILPGAASALLDAMSSNPTVGVAGAKLLNPDRSLQQSAFHFPGLLQLAFELFPMPRRLYDTPLNGRYPRHLYEGDHPFPIDHPLGASMMVRSATVDDVGLLDEGYRMYCEEIDWCWRMRKAGWAARCVPTAEVLHHAGRSTSQVPILSFVNLWRSRARLYARYHGAVSWRLAQRMVSVAMRRKMRKGTPEMADACRDVLEAWGMAR